MTDRPTKPPVGQPTRQPVEEPAKPSTVSRVQHTAKRGYEIGKIIVLAALAVVATLFVLRNWDDITLDYVFNDVELPLALVMIGAGLLGAAIGLLVYWLTFRDSD